VDLGDFGPFSLRVRGAGAETGEAISAHLITQIIAAFRPGKLFKDVLKSTECKKA